MGEALSPRPVVSREFQNSFRRRRITDALAQECAERGYRATTVAHLASRARCARNTIYELFPNKEAIFLALLEDAVAELDRRVEHVCAEVGPDRHGRIEAALVAVLEWIALDPPAAHALLVDASSVPAAHALQLHAVAGFAERLRRVAPRDPKRPAAVEELLVDGIASILRYLVLAGGAKRAPKLLTNLCSFLEQPYVDA